MSSLAEAQRAAHAGEPGSQPPAAPEPSFVRALRGIDHALAKIEEIALALCLLALLLIGVLGAVKRNFLPPSPFWIDEAVRYSVFFIGLLGAALATQSERLFNIDMFARLMSVRGKLIIRMLSAAFTIGVCWIFLSSSLLLRDVLHGEEGELFEPTTGILSLPIAMIAIMVHLALHFLIAGYYLVTGGTPPELAGPQAPHA
jgi:TRAP-type C4-dicarboxylate transport system permease small subunit